MKATGEISWVATDPVTSRVGSEVRSKVIALQARFRQLTERGEGYLEVSSPLGGYPAVTMGFRGSTAVVHRFSSPDTVSLLVGEASVAEGTIEVPVLDDLAEFDAVFGVPRERAWCVVLAFAEGRELDDLGEWFEL